MLEIIAIATLLIQTILAIYKYDYERSFRK